VLARNALAEALFGAPALPGRAGNINWVNFTDPAQRSRTPDAQRPAVLAIHVANLRATHARRPADPEVNALIGDLLAASAEFRELWRRHDVAVLRASHPIIVHPQVGTIELDCETLLTASGEQSLILYTARPGTDAAEKLELLRVLGREHFAPSPADSR
jgi:hypothetical protein